MGTEALHLGEGGILYAWERDKGRSVGQRCYTSQYCEGNDTQGRNKSREMAQDGIGRAAGP